MLVKRADIVLFFSAFFFMYCKHSLYYVVIYNYVAFVILIDMKNNQVKRCLNKRVFKGNRHNRPMIISADQIS